MKRKLGFLISAFLVLIAFQNCKSFDTQKNLVQTSQCTEEIREKALEQMEWTSEICNQASAFKCNLAVFSPEVKDTHFFSEECIRMDGDTWCLKIATISYDTSGLRQNQREPAEAFDLGGSYNRKEYTCVLTELNHKGVPIIQTESDSLQETLLLAQNECLMGAK
ncbi:MAG: hypothetical protein H6625_09660 [Bdellovibrionaceae bacterium]|nr:hypothetical protein [Pseudobdellovibrionaceae bacterium]